MIDNWWKVSFCINSSTPWSRRKTKLGKTIFTNICSNPTVKPFRICLVTNTKMKWRSGLKNNSFSFDCLSLLDIYCYFNTWQFVVSVNFRKKYYWDFLQKINILWFLFGFCKSSFIFQREIDILARWRSSRKPSHYRRIDHLNSLGPWLKTECRKI